MTEGDIYKWRWAADEKHADSALYRSYHCKSQIAVFEGGRLFDTFWGQWPTDGSFLNPEHVTLTLIGNKADLKVLKDDERYYRPEDLIVMRHSNDSRAPTYVRPGTKRDLDTMRQLVVAKRDEALSEMRSAAQRLERLAVVMHKLKSGETEGVYL